MDYIFETMSESHRQAVIDIFNYHVQNSYSAYPEQPVEYRFFDRFLEMSRGYPAVAVKAGAEVVGFGFLRPFHPAATFQRTAEVAYFIMPEHTRQGLGTAMLEFFAEQAGKLGIDSLLASVSSRNHESLGFHLKNGFKECGRLARVCRKFGQDVDVVWLQKRLPEAETPEPHDL
ncbi:MAG: N-acetyltransferase family protein [Desulfobaccales bacterium]